MLASTRLSTHIVQNQHLPYLALYLAGNLGYTPRVGLQQQSGQSSSLWPEPI
jgi:hypothetical protein